MRDDPRLVWRHAGGARRRIADRVAEEAPLELSVQGEPLAVLMRTPGDDEDLAVGFLVGEGVVRDPGDVLAVTAADDRVHVTLAGHVPWDPGAMARAVYASSSCGVCGRASLDAILAQRPPPPTAATFDPAWIAALPDLLREHQPTFTATGGVHAVGFVHETRLLVREDVGRHNAFDKVVGRALREGWLPASAHVAVVSGRASFELVQKAVMAGASGLVAVGAPTTLAMSLADEHGLLLVGFCRGGTFNVYAGSERLRA